MTGHPIGVVKQYAERKKINHELGEDSIVITIDGVWQQYSVALQYIYPPYEMLFLLLTFACHIPEEKTRLVSALADKINDRMAIGNFVSKPDADLITFRYGLILDHDVEPTVAQVEKMITTAVDEADKFYPAFLTLVWGEDETIESALRTTMPKAVGRA